MIALTFKSSSFHRFVELPGELRNKIYKLLVVDDGYAIDICRKLPRVTQVNQQLREESLVVFLGYNNFYCRHVPDKVDFLVHWLQAIGVGNLRHLKRLRIDCTIPSIDLPVPDRPKACLGVLRPWHEMVACLSAFGLQPSQLRFDWARGYEQSVTGPIHFINAVSAFFFTKYALEPLLADYGLLHNSPTLNVLADLATAEKCTTSDVVKRNAARDAMTKVSALDTAHNSHPSCSFLIRSSYDCHMAEVFSEGANSIGRFYDLKYLHQRKGVYAYRHTKTFNAAFEEAVIFHHRRRLQGKREWSMGTQRIHPGSTVESWSKMRYQQGSTKLAVSRSQTQSDVKNSSRTSSMSTGAMMKKGTTIPTFGTVGAIVPASTLATFNSAVHKPSIQPVVAPRKAFSSSPQKEHDTHDAPGLYSAPTQVTEIKSDGAVQPTERNAVNEAAFATAATRAIAGPALGFSMFGGESDDSEGSDGESPFAAVQSSAVNGAHFTTGFSTRPPRDQKPAPPRPVFEFVTNNAGKKVLRRSVASHPTMQVDAN